jgi:hypothetical protein
MTMSRTTVALAGLLTTMLIPATAHADGSGLVAQWRFDEGAGQVVHDDGPFGLDGVLGASAAADGADPERIAGGLRFDGTDFVTLPPSSQLELQAMTVEATVRAGSSPGAYRYVVSRGGRGCFSGSYGLYSASGGGIAFYVFDGTRYVVSAAARISDVWDGDWHRVTGTFDGSALRLYVDGHPVGAPLAAPMDIDYATTGTGTTLGTYAGACNLPYIGDLESVRLFDTALSPQGVAGTPPSSPPLAPLAPEAPGEIVPAGSAPQASQPGGGAPGRPGPIANAPACTVKLSRTSVVAHRRTVVRARVGVKRAKVTARHSKHGRLLASARSNTSGVARLVLKPHTTGRLTVSTVGCVAASLKVTAH